MAKTAVFLAVNDEASKTRLNELNSAAKRLGGAVEFRLVDAALCIDEMARQSQGAIALHPASFRLLGRTQFTELVRRVPTIRLLQTSSAGTDVFDKPVLARMDVKVCNNGGANAVAVAEHAIALIVAVYRRLDQQIGDVKAGAWSRRIVGEPEQEFHTLAGKRVGIVGLGRVGSRLAKRLQGWECDVVFHDIKEFPREYEEAARARRVDLATLLSTSDVVSLHVPLDPGTRRMISQSQLCTMKRTSIMINTCRGPVVDEAALIAALKDRVIFGAGLDVVETEPIAQDNPLLAMANVIITPHQATRAIESTINARQFVVENISRLARGEPVESVVDPVEE
jgi:phosphoglycerate dehydrogenase-like enzyme